MSRVVLLDSGPLGMATHPRPNPGIVDWIRGLLLSGAEILVPEIADYEVRRELLRAEKTKGIERLDALKATMGYVPLTSEAMLRAAEFWAEARRDGFPTAAAESLDGDVILAGQAATLEGDSDEVIIATTNTKHLSRFARAELWDRIH